MNYWKRALLTLVVSAATTNGVEGRASASMTAFAPHRVPRATGKQGNMITSTQTAYQPCPTCETDSTLSTSIGKSSILSDLQQRQNEIDRVMDKYRQSSLDEPQQQERRRLPTLQDVEISLLPSDSEDATTNFEQLPLVIRPRHDATLAFLQDFLENNRSWIDEQIVNYGAVLIRGLDIEDAANVQTAIQAYQPDLNNEYRGTSPRSTQEGSEYIFSAAEVPSYYPIAQHLEMSFLPAPPKQLFFSALKAPKTVGGETALADFRKVYADLPTKLRNKLAEKKIRYRRTHNRVGAKGFTRDVASLQGWPDVFGTDDKKQVEAIAASEDMPVEWTGKDNDTFVSETISDAFQVHPVTGEPVWFNHAQVFHWTTFPAELLFAFRRTKQLRFLWHAMVVTLFSIVKYGMFGHKMALDASFGDGTPISWVEAAQIRHAVHKNMVFNRWQKGDILMIDNWSTSHGRQPTYDTGRKIVVAWSDPMEKPNEYQHAE